MKTPLYRLAPVLFLALLLAGCAGTVGSANSANSSPAPGSNTQGQLGITPSTFSFGSVAVGGSSSKTATFTAANADVQVSSADWNGQGYSLSGITFPVTVSAGQSVSFKVIFAPTTAGSTPGSVSFASNATDPSLTATMTGTGTSGSSTQHSVSLSWSPESSVSGYNIYRGTVSGGPYTQINPSLDTATVYTDSSVQAATTYFYVATSVNSSSEESTFSNQVTVNVPQ